MAEEQRRSGIGGIGDGIRTGVGILSAFKDAIGETLQDASQRGDLSPERARQLMRDAAQQLQTSLEEARERFDWVPRRDFDELREEVERLRERVARLEGGGEGSPPADVPGIIVTE